MLEVKAFFSIFMHIEFIKLCFCFLVLNLSQMYCYYYYYHSYHFYQCYYCFSFLSCIFTFYFGKFQQLVVFVYVKICILIGC